MKLKKLIYLMLIGVILICHDTVNAQVTYTLGNTAYYTKYASGGDIFANGEELGMWANTVDEQVVAWRNLETTGDNTGTTRSLQVGDVFTISVYATRANGQMGFSLNANASTGSWDNRYSNSRLYIQAEGTSGSWYVNHNGGNTSLNYNVSTAGHTYQFKVFITSLSTCNVEFYVDGTFNNRLMNLTLKGTAGANIDGFSLYLHNDDGNIYWKQTTAHQALGYVDLGYYLTSGTFTPGLVQNGLESNSTSTSKINNINIGGDAGTYVILNQTNTYSGSTTVNTNARLELQNIAALGSTNGVTVTSGGALSLYFASGTNTFSTYATTLNGAGVSGANGALRSTGGNNTWPGGITLASSSRVNADTSGAAGSLTLSGAISLAANTMTVGGTSSDVSITGKISGTGGVLAKDGNNTLILSNTTNDYSGGTILSAGTISLANNAVLGSGDLTFGSGATTCTIDVIDNTSRSETIKVVEASTAGVINVADDKTFTLNGAITSTGANAATKFGKSGSGTLIVSADGSSYPGQIQVGNGTVIVQNDGGLGTNTSTANRGIDLGLNVGDVSQANNVSVLATDGITVPQSIYIAPNTSSATRTIGLSGTGSTTFNNEIYLDGTLTASGGSGTVTLSGNLINTGGLISSGGNVILSGTANTFSGNTTITAGTLELQGSIANSAVTVQSGATLKINGDDVTVLSLTVNDGGVVEIEAGKSLTVTGALDNSGTITIKSNASGTGSLKHNTNDITATIQHYIPGDNSWHFLAIPVNQATMPAILDGNFAPLEANFNSTTGATYDFYKWHEGAAMGNPNWINLKNGDWSVNTSDFGNPPRFEFGKGYLVAYSSEFGGSTTKSVTGTMTNGSVDIPVTISGNTFNLIGNPYPSSIDWKAASGWIRTVITEYEGNNLWIWNDDAGQFGAYNSSSGVDNGTNGVTRYIAPGQAFFVKASSAGNISMTNDVRVHSTQAWLKQKNNASAIRLHVGNDVNSYSDEAVIEFGHNNASGGADKFYSMFEEAPSIYSLKNEKAYSINLLGDITNYEYIPVGFKAGVQAIYTLEVSGLEGFEIVKLFDRQTNYIQDLKTNHTYSFASNPEDLPNRFEIHFGALSINESPNLTPAYAYVAAQQLHVVQASGNTTVRVLDVQGRLLLSSSFVADGPYSETLQLPAGVYVVSLTDEAGVRNAKIVVSN